MPSKASKAQAALRVEDLAQVRLDGAFLFAQIREYVRTREQETGSPWTLAKDEEPLSDSQKRRYIRKADSLIAESFERKRGRLIHRHIGQRRSLFARAVTTGELRTALACLESEAALLGLQGFRLARPAGGPEKEGKVRLAEAFAFYEGVLSSPAASLADKMRAQEGINKLAGLERLDIEERLAELEKTLLALKGTRR
jgi:hypothetical protein